MSSTWASMEERLVLSAMTRTPTLIPYKPDRGDVPDTSATKACHPGVGRAEKVRTLVPDGPVTLTIPSTRPTPVAIGKDQFRRSIALPGSAEVTFAFATVCRIHAVSSKRLAMPTRASSKYTLPPERFGPYRRNWRGTRPDLADPNWVRSTTTSCHPAARLCDCVVWNVGPTYAVTLKVRGRFAVETRTQRTKRSDIDQSTGWERCTPAHGCGPVSEGTRFPGPRRGRGKVGTPHVIRAIGPQAHRRRADGHIGVRAPVG